MPLPVESSDTQFTCINEAAREERAKLQVSGNLYVDFPSRVIFLVFSPSSGWHLSSLSRLCVTFQHEDFPLWCGVY